MSIGQRTVTAAAFRSPARPPYLRAG
jgi:hypothetical protein